MQIPQCTQKQKSKILRIRRGLMWLELLLEYNSDFNSSVAGHLVKFRLAKPRSQPHAIDESCVTAQTTSSVSPPPIRSHQDVIN